MEGLCQYALTNYAKFVDVEADKDFAERVKAECPKSLFSLMFKLRKKETTPLQFFSAMDTKLLETNYLKPFEEGEGTLNQQIDQKKKPPKKKKPQETPPTNKS